MQEAHAQAASAQLAPADARAVQLDERLKHRRATKARRKEASQAARAASRVAQMLEPPQSEAEQRARWEATAARQRLNAERERVKASMRVSWADESAGVRVVLDLGMQSLMA